MLPYRRKTDPNHKARFSRGVCCHCSCGWYSATWFGLGAQRNAAGEWHSHRDKCEPLAKPAEAPAAA